MKRGLERKLEEIMKYKGKDIPCELVQDEGVINYLKRHPEKGVKEELMKHIRYCIKCENFRTKYLLGCGGF